MTQRPQRLHLRHLLVSTQAGSNDDMSMPIHCLPNVCPFQRKHAQAMTEAMTFPSFTS